MPFVIGVMGIGGAKPNEHIAAFREAMAAPATLPEFQGNVAAVPTAPFWDEKLGAIADNHDQVRQMGYLLGKSKDKNQANADGSMTASERQPKYLKQFEAKLISPCRASPVETRRFQRRLPLPRLREDLRPHGKSLRRRPPLQLMKAQGE